ncbi:uncharacterized protein [Diadema antillarum]|uniref:uncharacterized protein n=1 Tax=Diadema antillarum TaxID=105358 RepID=UPI003A89CF06
MAVESDLARIGRLKEEEEKALFETLEKVRQWEKFDEDYTALKTRLSTLPDKVSHPIMVPFGKLAFMPGKLVHTNEILVLLGDNWFAERSAKQACDVIDRRKKYVGKMIDDLKKQQYLLESRLGFVSDLKSTTEGRGDVVEIREDYDAEKEAKWREQRRANKKKKKASAEPSPPPQTTATTKPSGGHQSLGSGGEEGAGESGADTKAMSEEEERLWARLDELERQEEELDEMDMLDEDYEEETVASHKQTAAAEEAKLPTVTGPSQRHVHWGDEQTPPTSEMTLNLGEDDSDDEDEEDGDDDGPGSTSVIHFTHNKGQDKQEPPMTENGKDISPRSPGDIYELYHSKSSGEGGKSSEVQPRSILKHSRESSEAQPTSVLKQTSVPHQAESTSKRKEEAKGKRQPLPAPVSAFTGNVVEHSHSAVPSAAPVPSEQGQGSKRVSKFKAARQGKR